MTLDLIVRTYIRRVRPRAQAELDWFIRQPTLRDATKNAALARNSKGKRYSHQRRIKRAAIQEALSILPNESDRIKRCRTFAELFKLIDTALEGVSGIGELYVYDTSLRIGAKLNLFPEKVISTRAPGSARARSAYPTSQHSPCRNSRRNFVR